jgi:N-acyl-D-aspartate/D-glutamate deacylase
VLYDGTGAPTRAGDLATRDGRIVSVGDPVPRSGAVEEFDAAGLAVSPGFVDLHTHSDVSLLSEPHCVSSVAQGITTQAVGLCGFSAAPLSPETLASMIEEEPHAGYPDVHWNWETIGGYLESVARARPATNVVTLVGHNTLRRLVMGSARRAPTALDLARMQDLLRTAISEGARGFSTGLSYAPGCFADQDELVALARVTAHEGRPYHTHMRYGGLSTGEMLAEALETAERAEVAINVSHLFPSRADPPDEVDRLVDAIESARARGVEVTFDLTPFPWGGGAWAQSLPEWVRDGGMARIVERLRDDETRTRIVAETWGPGAAPWMSEWDDQLIVKVNRPENAGLVGRSIGEIARERSRPPSQTSLDLLTEDGQFWVAPIIKRQTDLDRLLAHRLCVPITDGMSSHPEKHKALGLMPKSFGAFPLVLGSYVRERGVLSLTEAIRRMTSVPAERLGLADRGALAPGLSADIVVFDPATIANRSTPAEPATPPVGIHRVMVNGEWVVVDGTLTGRRPGRVL